MRFSLTEEEEFLRSTARHFLEAESPLSVVRGWEELEEGFAPQWWNRSKELGWTTLLVPESWGGAGLGSQGIRYVALVVEECGRRLATGPLIPTSTVMLALVEDGSDSQRDAVLPPLASGETVATWAVAEPECGWDMRGLSTRATRGETGYVLTGVKTYVEAGADADLILVAARDDDGPCQFLVPQSASGVRCERMAGLDLFKRFATVYLDNVDVPFESRLANANLMDRQFAFASALQCAESVGAAREVLDFTMEYAEARFSFGRPLSSYQALKHRFADMKLWLESACAITDSLVDALVEQRPETAELTHAAKAYCGEFLPELIQDCVQMHGGIGVTWEHDIHLFLRRCAVNRLAFGGPSFHRERLADGLITRGVSA
jgi:alkylation response protein AidB-like acyl-CoA dehydrogenase